MKFTIVVVPDSNADHEAYLALAVEEGAFLICC